MNLCTVADFSGVVTTSPPKPEGNTTTPPSGPVPTSSAPEPTVVDSTALPPIANITIPPSAETITELPNEENGLTNVPDNTPPQHSGTVVIPQQHLYIPDVGTS